jgi:sugar phosphate isomerase/epimerase
MRLSCPEQMLGDRPLAAKLALVREAGFDGVDLRYETLVEAGAPPTLSAAGLPVASVYSQVRSPSLLDGAAHDRARALAHVVERAEAAAQAGAANLILVPVFGEPRIAPPGPGLDLATVETALLFAALKEIAGRLANLPIVVVLEPLNAGETHFLRDPAVGAAVCEAVASPRVATMVDTYHCHREGQDPAAKVRAVGRHLALVHLSDSDRGLPGEGSVDFAAVVASLADAGYDGWAGYECRRVAGREDDDALRRSVAHVRELTARQPAAVTP